MRITGLIFSFIMQAGLVIAFSEQVIAEPAISFHRVLERPEYGEVTNSQKSEQFDLKQWKLVPDVDGVPVIVEKKPLLTADDIIQVSAEKTDTQFGSKQQSICLSGDGAKKLADFSRNHIGKSIAIVVDGVVLMTPVIQGQLLGGSLSVSSGPQSKTGAKLYAKFQSLQKKQQNDLARIDKYCSTAAIFDRGLAYLSAALAKDKQNIQLLLDRAQYLQTGNLLEKALADYETVLKIYPMNKDALFGQSEVLYLQKKYDLALQAVEKVFALDPDYQMLYLQRGVMLAMQNKHQLAIEDFNRSIARYPEISVPYTERANAYFDLGRYDQALDDYSRAIELEGNSSDNFNNRAWTYFKVGQLAKGLLDANKAIKIDPDNGYAFGTRGHIFEAMGEKKKAISDFREALKFEPELKESKAGLKRLGAGP